ncbi:MAG: flavodoxin domain-containing protein, partial [Planctomycetota bacterium]
PDSMFTYLTGKNILMPNDAFGQHYATGYRFNDQVDQEELWEEALKYYVNILTPFSPMVEKKIQQVLDLGLPVDVIAPSHGVIWRDNPMQIVEKYREWAAQEPEERATVVYDTMWEATRKMADAIGEGLADEGIDHKVIDAAQTDRNDLLVEVFQSRTLAVGSPTFNRGVLPTIAPLCQDLQGLGLKNKVGAAFGSYGWSGDAPEQIQEHLEAAEFSVIDEPLAVKWQPNQDDLAKCREYGRKLADATRQA